MNMAAPPGGAEVFLSSSAAVASIPSSVLVPEGQTSASFTVTTSAVTATNLVTISASHNGTASAVLTVTPAGGGGTVPVAPTLVSPANDAQFSPEATVTFDWSDVAGATSYTIQIDNSDTFSAPLTVSQTVTASQYTNSALPTTRMWWRVRASNAAGSSAWSAVRRFELK
jgi:hypothetical protein